MTEKDITFRLAREADAATIHRMLKALGVALGKPDDVRSTVGDIRRHGFADPPRFEAVLAEEAGDAVGLALYIDEFSSWDGTPGIYVQDLYVDERLRGRGVGRALLAAVRAHTSKRGATYLGLSVDKTNGPAIAFYEALGFAELDKETVMMLTGDAFHRL